MRSNQDDEGANDSSNEYERIREENIRRNAQVLRDLGLATGSRKPRKAKRLPSDKVAKDADLPRRRSARNKGVPAPDYSEEALSKVSEWEEKASQRKRAAAEMLKERRKRRRKDESSINFSDSAEHVVPKDIPDRARDLKIDINRFVSSWLGKELPVFGKNCVMATASPVEGRPRFNKYSGVAEWLNALFLFVNIGGDDYENQFLDNNKRMTWFGGSRMHKDSSVIKRLKEYGKAAEIREDGQKTSGLVLLCRFPGEAYVCCGRLKYVEHSEDTMPLRFVWELMDADDLTMSEPFKQMLNA